MVSAGGKQACAPGGRQEQEQAPPTEFLRRTAGSAAGRPALPDQDDLAVGGPSQRNPELGQVVEEHQTRAADDGEDGKEQPEVDGRETGPRRQGGHGARQLSLPALLQGLLGRHYVHEQRLRCPLLLPQAEDAVIGVERHPRASDVEAPAAEGDEEDGQEQHNCAGRHDHPLCGGYVGVQRLEDLGCHEVHGQHGQRLQGEQEAPVCSRSSSRSSRLVM